MIPRIGGNPKKAKKKPSSGGNPLTDAERKRQRERDALARAQANETNRSAKASPQETDAKRRQQAALYRRMQLAGKAGPRMQITGPPPKPKGAPIKKVAAPAKKAAPTPTRRAPAPTQPARNQPARRPQRGGAPLAGQTKRFPGKKAPAPAKSGGKSNGVPVKPTAPVATPGPDPLEARANAIVSAELDPQIAELQRQMQENRTTGTDAMSKVTQMYDLASQATEANRGAAATTYDTGEDSIRKLYQEAADDAAKQMTSAKSQAEAEQARLGIQVDNSKFDRDAAYLSGLNQSMGAASAANLDARSQDADAMFRRLASGISADAAVRKSDIASGMNELGRELSAQAGILNAYRKSKVLTILGELQDKQAATQAEAEQQAFLNEIAARKLGISERQLNANIAKMKGDQRIAAAKVELTRKKNESDAAYKARMARIAAANSSTSALRAAVAAENAKVDRDLKRSQTMENIAQVNEKNTKPGSGYDAARAYVNKQTAGQPGGGRVANNIKSILTIYTPSRAKSIEARGGDLWTEIRKSKYYQSLPNSVKGMVVQAYQIAYGKI